MHHVKQQDRNIRKHEDPPHVLCLHGIHRVSHTQKQHLELAALQPCDGLEGGLDGVPLETVEQVAPLPSRLWYTRLSSSTLKSLMFTGYP